VSSLLTWRMTRSSLQRENVSLSKSIEEQSDQAKAAKAKAEEADRRSAQLKLSSDKYFAVKQRLERSSVVREFVQPVLLIGPRNVGKTSLLMQWHAPWEHGAIPPTARHRTYLVPVQERELPRTEAHFADPEIYTSVTAHLKLRIHDFPGEEPAQRLISKQASKESLLLREQTQSLLGVVVICMFDASEVIDGRASSETRRYYNGDLFSNLRSMVSRNVVKIERLVLVFNKYDLLRAHRSNATDQALMEECRGVFGQILEPLWGVCNPDRVCEMFSVLEREDIFDNNRGASVALGEAARGLVYMVGGQTAVDEVIGRGASRVFAREFPPTNEQN
jgi:GTPase SAR1 family protein